MITLQTLKTKIKHFLYSLIPVTVLIISLESIFALAGMGKPFVSQRPIWNGPIEIVRPDPYCSYRLKPNVNLGSIHLNSLGFRDNELNRDADIKILVLGDSVAFGWGVDDFRNTYSEIIEKILAAKGGDHKKTIEVFNAGIPSYDLYLGFQLYTHYLTDVTDWDYVIVSFAWNEDLENMDELAYQIQEYDRRNPPDENIITHTLRKWAMKFRTYNVLENLYARVFISKKSKDSKYPYARYRNLLLDFIRMVKRNNSRPILLAAQVREEDKNNIHGKPMLRLNTLAKDVAREENIPFVDTDPFFKLRGSGWYDTVHFDEKGHRITAEALSSVLSKELGFD